MVKRDVQARYDVTQIDVPCGSYDVLLDLVLLNFDDGILFLRRMFDLQVYCVTGTRVQFRQMSQKKTRAVPHSWTAPIVEADRAKDRWCDW